MSKQSHAHVNMGHFVRGANVEGGVVGAFFTSVERSLPALMISGSD